MDKPFEVKAVKGGRIHAISFSLDSSRPEDYFDSLEETLNRLNVDGEVLLDLLACNGQTSRRYFTVRFDGNHLAFNTLRVEKESSLEPSVLSLCSSFYSQHVSKLHQSVLSESVVRKLGTAIHWAADV